MKTILTSSGFTPARSSAALMAIAPSRGAGRDASVPWNAPIGVRASFWEGPRRAAEAGLRVLMQGGSALDAAQAAAVVLEDDPIFNAGTGAALTSAGEVELDASCMDGTSLRAGAVACVRTVKNPILLARRVCDDTPHVLICARGAEAFARECGIPEVPNALMVTQRQSERWRELHAEAQRVGADVVRKKIGTIGAVAVDARGRVAACTS